MVMMFFQVDSSPNWICLAEREIEDFEDSRRDADDNTEAAKVSLTVKEMDIYKVGEKYYFISGEDDIFLLHEDDEYSRKLSESEIEALSFRVSWVGPSVKTVFDDNDEKAVNALVNIIADYTAMVQEEKFHGFALASLVTHLRAYLYPHILAEQRDFYSSITLSGAQRGTGKYPIPMKKNNKGRCN